MKQQAKKEGSWHMKAKPRANTQKSKGKQDRFYIRTSIFRDAVLLAVAEAGGTWTRGVEALLVRCGFEKNINLTTATHKLKKLMDDEGVITKDGPSGTHWKTFRLTPQGTARANKLSAENKKPDQLYKFSCSICGSPQVSAASVVAHKRALHGHEVTIVRSGVPKETRATQVLVALRTLGGSVEGTSLKECHSKISMCLGYSLEADMDEVIRHAVAHLQKKGLVDTLGGLVDGHRLPGRIEITKAGMAEAEKYPVMLYGQAWVPAGSYSCTCGAVVTDLELHQAGKCPLLKTETAKKEAAPKIIQTTVIPPSGEVVAKEPLITYDAPLKGASAVDDEMDEFATRLLLKAAEAIKQNEDYATLRESYDRVMAENLQLKEKLGKGGKGGKAAANEWHTKFKTAEANNTTLLKRLEEAEAELKRANARAEAAESKALALKNRKGNTLGDIVGDKGLAALKGLVK